MRAMIFLPLAGATQALAHPGHHALAVHFHAWDFALLGVLAVIGAAVVYRTRRK